jgi:hypothetical protein
MEKRKALSPKLAWGRGLGEGAKVPRAAAMNCRVATSVATRNSHGTPG